MRGLRAVSRGASLILVGGFLLFAGCDGDIWAPSEPDPGAESNGVPLTSSHFLFLPPVCDDGGPNDVPEQSDLNCFSRADNVSGSLGVQWSWDDIDQWTGTGQTGDACGLFDTDGDANADLAVCVQITNNADGSEVLQLPTIGAATAYECSDKKPDRCSKQVTLLSSSEIGSTTCNAVVGPELAPWAGDDTPYDVLAECDLDLDVLPNASNTNLLNVCSFPSGEPNSNPFDCVITPGAGYLVIQKATTPASTQDFSFTLSPAARDGTTGYSAPGSDGSGGPGSSSLIAVAPGTYTVTETVPGGWQLSTASCTDGSSTFAANAVTGIVIETGQTITCTFNNTLPPGISITKTATPNTVPETGGNVSYALVVTNTSGAALTLNSLGDDVFGDVTDGDNNAAITSTDCSVPQSLAAAGQEGDSYSCAFVAALVGDASNGTHINEVTAGASNSAGNATAKDTAKVEFGEVLPSISVTKMPSVEEVEETGGDVTYTVLVTNLSAEAASLTALVDDVFGILTDGSNPLLISKTCSVPQPLAPSGEAGDSYDCTFTSTVSGTPGVSHVNEVTATATDDDGNQTTATANATVGIGAVDPTLSLVKTASTPSVPETGGSVSYTVDITNTSLETITLNSLTDDKFGDLDGNGTCSMPQTLQPLGTAGDSYSCTFTETVSGEAGAHTNLATVTGQDDDGQPTQASDDATVTLADVLPDITVTKTPSPASVPETGGDVTFTVLVTNNSAEPVSVTSLTDDKFLDLNGQGDCSVPQPLAATGEAGDSYSCSFTETLASLDLTDHVNTVTAVGADNEGNEDTETASATVTFTNVEPDITVTKTANPETVPETGSPVTFSVTVANNSAEPVTLTSLSDDRFGALNGQGDCVVPQSLAATGEAGDSYSCSFDKTLSNGVGTPHVNVVTAIGTDSEGNTDTETDDASVSFSAVIPTISITKTASPTSVPETGGSVTYSVLVTNTGGEAVTLTALSDDVFGDVADGSNPALTSKSCSLGQALAVSGAGLHTYACQFVATISGNAGTDHVNTLTATAVDDDGSEATANDNATVTFADVPPDITVTKTVSPETLGGTAVASPPPPTAPILPTANGYIFIPPVYDDGGPNDVPEQSDLNWFTRADNQAGRLGVRWAWDDIDQWTGTGQTGDACGLFDTDADGNANLAVCAQITNNADGTQVIQLPSDEAAIAYECSDKKSDRCTKQVIELSAVGTTTCTVGVEPEDAGAPWQGDDGSDVVAECDLDLAGLGVEATTDLLNVCSFPSGSPNSNPFDCVVTPGAGFLLIQKTASPATSQSFGFTLSPAATDGTASFNVTAGSSSALIPVSPGSGYSLTESTVANWTLNTASCSDVTGTVGTYNGTDAVTGIPVQTGRTVTCTFDNLWSLSSPVNYTIVVTNNSFEPATLNYLNDDIFGALGGVGSCSLNQALAATGEAGASYTCGFTKTLTGNAGDVHTNTVTAKASDDDTNTDTETDFATVTFIGP